MDPHSPKKFIATKYCFPLLGDDTSFFFFLSFFLSFFFVFKLCYVIYFVIINFSKNCFYLLFLFLLLLLLLFFLLLLLLLLDIITLTLHRKVRKPEFK